MEILEGPAVVTRPERARYEAYLTDPRTERMKTKWQTELAIRLA